MIRPGFTRQLYLYHEETVSRVQITLDPSRFHGTIVSLSQRTGLQGAICTGIREVSYEKTEGYDITYPEPEKKRQGLMPLPRELLQNAFINISFDLCMNFVISSADSCLFESNARS